MIIPFKQKTARVRIYCQLPNHQFPYFNDQIFSNGCTITKFLMQDLNLIKDHNNNTIPGDVALWYLATNHHEGALSQGFFSADPQSV